MEAGLLGVTSAIGTTSEGTYTKGPKNKSSTRRFSLIPQLKETLEARRKYVRGRYGAVLDNWFVLGDTIHYKAPTTPAREFTRFVRRNDLRDHFGKQVTPHCLRHNLATVGVRSNMDIASLAEMMGHASKAMTLDAYSSSAPEAMQVAAGRLGDAFGQGGATRMLLIQVSSTTSKVLEKILREKVCRGGVIGIPGASPAWFVLSCIARRSAPLEAVDSR